jgi:hypothetical protein
VTELECRQVLLPIGLLVLVMPVWVGCKTASLSQEGRVVRISPSAPVDHGFDPRSCRSLGYLVGRGGGSFGGGYISNERLVEYAMNDLRNQAAERGANYVQHDSPQLGTSGSNGSSTTTTATVSGTAYHCTRETTFAAPAQAPVPSEAPAPRAPPQPKTWSDATPHGHKELKLILTAGTVRIGLRATPALSRDVALLAEVNGRVAPAACELRLASHGERVPLSPPAPPRTASDPTASAPIHAHGLISLDALRNAASAQRVAGRICDDEFVWGAAELAAIQDYVLQFQETLALLPDPTLSPAGGTEVDPTNPASPSASQATSPKP